MKIGQISGLSHWNEKDRCLVCGIYMDLESGYKSGYIVRENFKAFCILFKTSVLVNAIC